MKIVTTISRVFVGALFIFSGFIKANDPLGFGYKLQEYFEVFNMHWMIPLSLFLAIFICIFEVAVGFALLIGARPKLVLWLLSLMMVFFTFLTFYSAYYNKVTSCGCFGDAIPLTPWQSFYKDIILCTLTLVLIVGRSHVNPLLGARLQMAVMYLFIVAATAFPLYTSTHLPIIDFRPYKIGTNLYRAIHPKEKFFYMLKDKKTGEQKEFDHWPTDWDKQFDYVSNRTEPLDKTVKPITGFSMQNSNGEDHTDEFLTLPGCSFILVEYDLNKSNRSVQGSINDFSELCKKDSISFVALTSSDTLKINSFKKETEAAYDFYINPDEVPLKTMIRPNPGLVMIKDCVVTAMWPYRALPSYNDVKATYFGKK
ncbi:MAG: DoxX family protein [Bacteroidia bacterium]|nr:DoxX family protein [Bacteroidia bacterium]